jgi:hypothetical protein
MHACMQVDKHRCTQGGIARSIRQVSREWSKDANGREGPLASVLPRAGCRHLLLLLLLLLSLLIATSLDPRQLLCVL